MEFELEVESFEENFEEKTESEKTESEVKQQKQSRPFCKCKKCGGDILELKYFYACSNYCGVKVWKEFLRKQLTENEVKDLLNGKEIYLTELKSASGKIFNAYARYDFDQCKVILRFESNKQSNQQNKQESKQSKQGKQSKKK